MTLNFADLTQRLRAGNTATEADLLSMIEAGPGATFALVEFAAEFRRTYFSNIIEIANLIGANGKVSEQIIPGANLLVGNGESAAELVHTIFALGQNKDTSRITVDFLGSRKSSESIGEATALTPMHCLRVLAAVRLVAPAKSLRVGRGWGRHLRSLQPLVLHAVDSLYLSDYPEVGPQTVFEELKMIRGAGLTVLGAAGRDLASEYVAYLQAMGVADAQGYVDLILADDDAVISGGCGGSCGCGAGGCCS